MNPLGTVPAAVLLLVSPLPGVSCEQSDYANYGTPDSWLHILKDPDYRKTRPYGKLSYFLDRDGHRLPLFAHHTQSLPAEPAAVGRLRCHGENYRFDLIEGALVESATAGEEV